MKLLIHILLTMLIFLNISLYAQWTNIPNPGVPTSIILPVGNNKIIYAGKVQISASSGGYIVANKADDFGNKSEVYYASAGMGANPFMVSAASYNDSVVCLQYNLSSYETRYTNNGFKNTSVKGFGGSGSLSVFNTGQYLFALTPKLSVTSDTMMIARVVNGVSRIDTAIYLPNYSFDFNNQKALKFLNDSTGFVTGAYKSNTSKTVILKTKNYGNNWNEIFVDSISKIKAYSFPTKQTGYVVRADGNIFKTTDGGSMWVQVNHPNPVIANTVTIAFCDNNIGYVGGTNGTLAKTIDGGSSWTIENSGTTATITNIYTFGLSAYFTTSANTLFKNSPKGVNITEHDQTLKNIQIYPNPSEGNVTIEMAIENTSKLTFSIKNLMGQEVYSAESFYGNTYSFKTLDLSFLNAGIYFISVKNEGLSYTKKVILNK